MTTPVAPAPTYRESMLEHATRRLLKPLGVFDWRGRATVLVLALLSLLGAYAWFVQLRGGLAVTSMRDYFSWGIYIVNFVFFIGLSMAGTLISAILHLSKAPWRAPITRMAECITVCALMIAGGMIIMDMGRPDRLHYTLLHPRVQSPILWDILSLNTYLFGSALYLYISLIPDIALLRDRPGTFSPRRHRLYEILALGWTGSPAQRARLERMNAVMALAIIPVAVSIHTVTAWLFGLTLRPGWHSSIIGPDFVVGAVFSGSAAVIAIMALFRGVFHLERFITLFHFRKLAALLLGADLMYAYFMLNEYVGGLYTKEEADDRLLHNLFSGPYATQFWTMFVIGLVIPAIMLMTPRLRSVKGIVAASLLVNVGMWLKRYIIVVPTLATPFMPLFKGNRFAYSPTWVEWAITAGGFALFGLLFIAFSRYFPVVAIWELQEEAPGDEPAPGHAPGPVLKAAATAGSLVLLAALFTPARTRAADPGVPVAAPSITVTASNEGGEHLLLATVLVDGKAAPNVTVDFYAVRSFGRINLGHDTTLPDGTAAVPFPESLPGEPDGNLRIQLEVTAPEALAGATGAGLVTAAVSPRSPPPAARELWSRRAPWSLLATVGIVVTAVWAVYFWVILNLFKIRKEASS